MTIIECANCGKKFILNRKSIYRLRDKNKGMHYYCGYNCWIAKDTRRYNHVEGRYSKVK